MARYEIPPEMLREVGLKAQLEPQGVYDVYDVSRTYLINDLRGVFGALRTTVSSGFSPF